MKKRYLLLVLAIFIAPGVLVASCGGDDSTNVTNDCGMSAGRPALAPAALAMPTSKSGRSSVDRPARRPSVRVSKAPARHAAPHVSPHPSKSSGQGRSHIDLDVELGGC